MTSRQGRAPRLRRALIAALAVVVALWLAAVWVERTPHWYLPGDEFQVGADTDNRVNGRFVEAGSRSDGTVFLTIGRDPMAEGLHVGDSVTSTWWGRLTVVRVMWPGNPDEPGSGGGAFVRWTPW